MDNRYISIYDAITEAAKALPEGSLLTDNAWDWGIDNLLDEIAHEMAEGELPPLDGDQNYYVVGVGGQVGVTVNDGASVEWIFIPKLTK